ncbi:MAG: chorismate-binding protein, partial [Burkholderiales bacterium]|nr:chorismate-binding protein [Burkholderiales bacterium]
MNDRMPDACAAAPSASDTLFAQFATLHAAQQHDTSLFSSHDQCLLTRGIAHQLHTSTDLPQQAAQLLQTVQDEGRYVPLLVGAIPFSPSTSLKSQLFVPQQVFTAQGPQSADTLATLSKEIASYPSLVSMQPDADQYRANVRLALQHIAAGKLQKVVLARALRLQSTVAVGALLQRLRAN